MNVSKCWSEDAKQPQYTTRLVYFRSRQLFLSRSSDSGFSFFQPTLLSLTISFSKLETTSVVAVSTEYFEASSLEKSALCGHQSDDELIHGFETSEEELSNEYFTSFYLLGSVTAIRMNLCTGSSGLSYIVLVLSQINAALRPNTGSQIDWICCF